MNDYLKKIIFLSLCCFFVFNFQVSFSQEEQEKANFTGNKFNTVEIDEADSTYVWFGTNTGIIKYNRADKKWDYAKNNLLNVNAVTVDPYEKNYIWIGTNNSINKYDRKTDKVEIIRIKLLSEKADTTSQNDKLDSTVLRGIDSTFVFFSAKVNSIVIDKIDNDNVWAATNTGLLKYNRKSDKWVQYTKKEGLQDNKINIIAIDKINPD
ncbi:hypothetical protein HY745_00035, partial [Candidatus Desantisbacteria bacterium]|nr:hypothetical protein [Candidatus Desantisbacteria bacterium]